MKEVLRGDPATDEHVVVEVQVVLRQTRYVVQPGFDRMRVEHW
jgi:hypothetical protein